MTICEYCEEVLGATEMDCNHCPYGNPCYGCEHDENGDCKGQCYSGEDCV